MLRRAMVAILLLAFGAMTAAAAPMTAALLLKLHRLSDPQVSPDGRTVVFLEQAPGIFQQIPVTVGKRVGDRISILSGVKAGDRIVADGAMLLKPF